MHAYLYIYLRLFQRTTLPARLASRMHEHAAHTSIASHIALTSSHYSDEPNAIIFVQVLALRFLIERRYYFRAALPPLTKSDTRC